jgi:hypothetical protein
MKKKGEETRKNTGRLRDIESKKLRKGKNEKRDKKVKQ